MLGTYNLPLNYTKPSSSSQEATPSVKARGEVFPKARSPSKTSASCANEWQMHSVRESSSGLKCMAAAAINCSGFSTVTCLLLTASKNFPPMVDRERASVTTPRGHVADKCLRLFLGLGQPWESSTGSRHKSKWSCFKAEFPQLRNRSRSKKRKDLD